MKFENKEDMKGILGIKMSACVLHNLLIDSPVLEEWLDDNDALHDDDKVNPNADACNKNMRRTEIFNSIIDNR